MTAPVLPPGIETLPPWVQVAVTIFVFAAALFISYRSIIKPANVEKSRDVVVPSVSVMDGQIFKEATEQLRAQARSQELRDMQVRELQRELRTQTEIMQECRDALRTSCDTLESIEAKMKKELKRQADSRAEA